MSLADDASYPIGMIPAIKLEHLGLLIGCCSASIGVDPEHVLSWVDVLLVPFLFFGILDLRFLDVLILDSCFNSVIVIGRSLDLLN